jgi:hypothetical protein
VTGQLSPDGQWKWDGTQWVPNTYVYGEQPAAPAGLPAAPGGPPQQWTPPTAQTGEDWKPIASLICGIAAFFVGLTAIGAVILGHMARADARREGRRVNPMATIGLILGWTFIIGTVLLLLVALALITNL